VCPRKCVQPTESASYELTTGQLINPNIRASILSGLMYPHLYLASPRQGEVNQDQDADLHDLPDTSILFRRYLDSGKFINVYDWYQSFAAVCEIQRERGREAARPSSPRKNKGGEPTTRKGLKSNGKVLAVKGRRSPRKAAKAREEETPLESEDEVGLPAADSAEEDGWNQQVHTRFMRALHELDYVGLIQHTGRKKDCVIRTVWEQEWEDLR
jgi:origin recognition complex subunit 3